MHWVDTICHILFIVGVGLWIAHLKADRDHWRRKAERFYEAIVEFQNAVPDYWQREWCDCATFYPMGDCPDDADDWCIYKHLYDAADKATREVR